MTEESSKKLIKLLTIISFILVIAFFSNIMSFVGSLFASSLAFGVLIYLSVINYLDSFAWFSSKIFNVLLVGLLIGAVIIALIRIAFKLIPKSQLVKYIERQMLYNKSEDAIKLFTSSIKSDIDEIIKPLTRLTEIKGYSSIYELFESDEIANENKEKISRAHYWLGYIYASEYPGKFNFKLATNHYNKSNFDSSIELGKLYFHGGSNSFASINTTNANHSKSIKYFFSALKDNRYEAATYIGLILRRGTVKNKIWIGFISVNYFNDDINSKRSTNSKLLSEAFSYFKTGASGNNVAKFYLGAMQYLGEGCVKDIDSARKNLEESIPYFYDEEIKYLVAIYTEGNGTVVDYVKALTYSLVAIQYDAAIANKIETFKSKLTELQISDAYCNASNFVSNELYVDYLQTSSGLGSIIAKETLIDLYRYGFGTILDKDLGLAFRLASDASSMNSAYATNVLAIMHEYGEGVEKNIDEAMRLYKIASELGSTDASVNLAINYQYGVGVEANIDIAIDYYLEAIEKGSHRAMLNLAYIHLSNKDVEAALELLKKILTAESSSLSKEAHSTLGQIYFDGELTKQDYELAFNHFKMSGDYSDTFGRLGYLYYFGYGTERNFNLAKLHLEQYLSNNDDGYHQYLLGWMYLNGEGAEVNLYKAIFYLEKSASSASKMRKNSIFMLGDIYSGKFDPSHKDLVKSLKWLYFAADNDFTEAYEKMKDIKEKLSSEGIEKARLDASEIIKKLR